MINWQLSKQGICWPVSPDRIAGSGVDPSRSSIFLKLSADKLLVFKWSRLKFDCFNSYKICFVFVPHNQNFDLNLTSDAKIHPAITGREGSCFWLSSPWSRVGHALRLIFMLWLSNNLTGEFMRKIYAASWNLFTLIAEADRGMCQLVMFLTAFFYWVYKKWNSAAIKSLLLFVASLFNGFLVEKYVACQSRKSHLRSHRFRFSPCLMRKRVEKSEAILALLDSFQGAASWMVSLSNYCIWCLFFISHLMQSRVVYAAIWFMHVCKTWDNYLTESDRVSGLIISL